MHRLILILFLLVATFAFKVELTDVGSSKQPQKLTAHEIFLADFPGDGLRCPNLKIQNTPGLNFESILNELECDKFESLLLYSLPHLAFHNHTINLQGPRAPPPLLR